jgi:hypothetical protein
VFLRDNDKVKTISGCFVVNEQRLDKLPDERFLEIRSRRFLPAVHAHLISLAQTERLVKLQEGLPAAAIAA